MATFRPVIAPVSVTREADDDGPRPLGSKWVAFSIVLGMVMGVLIVGWVYIEDHPAVPVGARQGSTAAARIPTAPRAAASAPASPLASASAATAALQGNRGGFIAIAGPPGARVYDGTTIVGTAPMMLATTAGAHVIRVQPAASKAQSFNVEVRPYETTTLAVAADADKKRRPQPGAAPARTTVRGLKAPASR